MPLNLEHFHENCCCLIIIISLTNVYCMTSFICFAEFNMLIVGIAGPRIPCEQIHIHHIGNLQYNVRYQLSQAGSYVLVVKWGEEHIPGSPFTILAQ